ncbi:DUF998 domain-containing protein [Nonomuraea sp. NPDC050310]|uniref:DUF998 domain-containing protein n=1 Tax=Nonomuraea sp. NPDC050310 TaxID=3154935 RepID=UPI0033F36C5B
MSAAVAAAAPARERTGVLSACGIVAGPIYVLVAAIQVLTREGFDLTRHPVSVLSNGDAGWIQIANFLVTGALTLAFAAGLARAGEGRWAPRLIALYGLGVVGAGLFAADPMDGFPIGADTTITWHGLAHLAVGGIGFLGLVAACLVLARAHAAAGRRGWAVYSAVTGVVFLAAFLGIASGARVPGLNLAFAAAVVAGWTWLSLTAARLHRTR